MWYEGSIVVNKSIIYYCVKHYEEGSPFGIDEGRVSKLMLKRGGEVIANYDRSWDIEPAGEDARTALAILLKRYN